MAPDGVPDAESVTMSPSGSVRCDGERERLLFKHFLRTDGRKYRWPIHIADGDGDELDIKLHRRAVVHDGELDVCVVTCLVEVGCPREYAV